MHDCVGIVQITDPHATIFTYVFEDFYKRKVIFFFRTELQGRDKNYESLYSDETHSEYNELYVEQYDELPDQQYEEIPNYSDAPSSATIDDPAAKNYIHRISSRRYKKHYKIILMSFIYFKYFTQCLVQ